MGRAHISSLEALESFRAALIIYLSKARPTIDEVGADVTRVRIWLEEEQRGLWENQLRKRRRQLEEAQQALFSAKLSNLREPSAAELNAVHRAKRAVDEAEDKVRILKKWAREFDGRVQPLLRQLEKLHTVYSNELPNGVARLTEIARVIQAYSEIKPPAGESPAPVDTPA